MLLGIKPNIMRSFSTLVMSKSLWFGLLVISFNSCEVNEPNLYPDYTGQRGIIYDIEGNEYKTIGIGSQIWLAENLRSTRLNDNEQIKYFTDSLDWTTTSYSGYCWYNNDTLLKIPYGGLYNWHSVNTGKLCPIGWHIPSEGDWQALIKRLGGEDITGGKLKVIGTDYWNSPNRGATNSSQFNAVPGGGIFQSHFWDFGKWSHFWSNTERDSSWITGLNILYSTSSVILGKGGKRDQYGLSVRCIKD